MLSFQAENNVLRIIRNKTVIYSISIGDILLSVGAGKNDYKMSHGSFKIKETLYNKVELKVNSFSVDSDEAVIALSEGAVRLNISGDMLFAQPEGLDKYNRMWIKLPALKNEYVYGGGEIFTEFNLRGIKGNVWVAEHINAMQIAKKLVKQIFGFKNSKKKQPYNNYETYYAQPTFISSRKYYYHSITTARSEFDFTNDDYHLIKTYSISPFYIGLADDFEGVLSGLTELVGRQPMLPDWVYNGHILGVQGGTKTMLSAIKQAENAGLPVAGLWIQDWEGRRVTPAGKQLYWNWQWDSELYPGLDVKIKELAEKGIKVLGYVNPFLAVEKPLYKEASEKGYCVKDKEGKDYYVTITTFPASMIDLTNPDAYEWIKGIIKTNMIDFGFSGWMADFGEYLPTDCVLYSGEDPELIHNIWGSLWAKVNREAVEEAGKLGEIVFFTRSGFSDTPRYSTLMWCGDNHVDFSVDFGLPSVIPAMLSLTCCGFGLSHSDVGGYTSFFNLKRSEELYMRWCEMNAFSPVMRGHEGLNPDINAQFNASEKVLKHGAEMAEIHRKLKPYLKSADEFNNKTGVGIVRPLFFYYDEKPAYEECYEYLLGRDILVAPVLDCGADKREVYLPKDNWVHLWTGDEYNGGVYTVDAQIGRVPVFVRKEAQDVLDIFNKQSED